MGRCGWLVLAGLSAPATMVAQVTLVGTVRNEQGAALPHARVELVRQKQAVTADAEGRYRLLVKQSGAQAVAAQAIGYRFGYRMTTLPAQGEVRIDWTLQQVPIHLPELEVKEEVSAETARFRSLQSRLRSYLYRGRILTRADLDRYGRNSLAVAVLPHMSRATIRSLSEPAEGMSGPLYLAGVTQSGYPTDAPLFIDMSSPLPATYTLGAGPSQSDYLTVRYDTPSSWFGGLGPLCSPAVSVNGATPQSGLTVASFSADEVHAVEVYRQAPVGCGLVVVWTSPS